MNDEIKEIKIGMYTTDEILEFMTNGEGRSFIGRSMYDAIIDYITNLQQENERLKEGYCELKVKCNNGICDCSYEEYHDMCEKNMEMNLLLEDYKSRIEKAVEYIEKLRKINYKTIDTLIEEATTLKEILNGENVMLNNILDILNGKE